MGAEQEESYRLIAKGDGFRIGLAFTPRTTAVPHTSIEFLLRLFRTGRHLSPKEMGRASVLVGTLVIRGYVVLLQEGGWISCERDISETDAEEEARLLVDIIRGYCDDAPQGTPSRAQDGDALINPEAAGEATDADRGRPVN